MKASKRFLVLPQARISSKVLRILGITITIFPWIFRIKFIFSEEIDHKSDTDSDLEDDGGHTGLLDNSEDVSQSLTTPSRGRQMNAENLDGKIVKALKKQEEKRDKRAQRKKEVMP